MSGIPVSPQWVPLGPRENSQPSQSRESSPHGLNPVVYCDTSGMAPYSVLTLLAILAKKLGKLNKDVTQ